MKEEDSSSRRNVGTNEKNLWIKNKVDKKSKLNDNFLQRSCYLRTAEHKIEQEKLL